MTTSDKTEDLNHPALRRLVDEADAPGQGRAARHVIGERDLEDRR